MSAGHKRLGVCLSSDQCTPATATWMKAQGISSVTPRWEMKPGPWLGARAPADRIAAFCRTNAFSLRIHTVAWHVDASPFMQVTDKATKRRQLQDFATSLVQAYGDIPDVCIDVANECFDNGGTIRSTPLVQSYGGTLAGLYEMVSDIVAAVKTVRDIPCFYNDYGYVEWPDQGKQDAIVALVKNTTVDGFGDQYHPDNDAGQPSVAALQAAVKRITDLGKRVQFTEVGIPTASPQRFTNLFTGGADAERFTFWGGWDANSDVSGGPSNPSQPWTNGPNGTPGAPKAVVVDAAHAWLGTPPPASTPDPGGPPMAAFADGDKVKITKGTFAGKQGEVTGFRVRRPDGAIANFEGTSLEPWKDPTPTPTPVPSADGTSIPPASSLTDSTGAVWTLVNGVATRNGVADTSTFGISKLVYKAKQVIATGEDGNPYAYQNGTWVKQSTPTPTPTPPPDPTPTPTPTPSGSLKKGIIGFGTTAQGNPAVVSKIAALGANWTRIDGDYCTPESVNAWKAAGITMLPIIYDDASFASRFPNLSVFEWWNEPYWGSVMTPASAAQRYVACRTKLKAINPNARLLFPVDEWSDWKPGAIDQMFNAVPNLASQIDAVAVHPYTGGTDPATPGSDNFKIGRVDAWRDKLLAHGVSANAKWWLTEVGWSSNDFGGNPPASYMTNLFKWVDARPWIEAVFIYQLQDQQTGGSNREQTFGQFTSSWQAKPQASVVANRYGGHV